MNSEIDDLTPLCTPKSDQLNADDLVDGPRILTLSRIAKGPRGKKGDQPVHIYLREFDRGPWKPPVSVRRLMMELWGKNPAQWPDGGRVELFRDPDVFFGDERAGGIRVSGVSHIDGDRDVLVTTGRGKRTSYRIRRIEGARPPANLLTVLADNGLTPADFDAWRVATSKPVFADMDEETRSKLAAYLAATPGAVAAIRAASTSGEE